METVNPARIDGKFDDQDFLYDWDENDYGKLLLHTDAYHFQTGDVVIRAGEIDRSLYIIVGGELEVVVPSAKEEAPRVVAILQAGSVLGDQAFLDSRPRSAEVRATTDGELLRLRFEEFQHFAKREPELSRSFLFDLGRILSLRLRRMTTEGITASAQAPMRVSAQALLPMQRIVIDQDLRTRAVAEITESNFFQELQQHCKQLRRQRERREAVDNSTL